MRERSVDLGPASVGHEPAGDGHSHGDERQKGGNDERDDEAHRRDAHLLAHHFRCFRRCAESLLAAAVQSKDRVGLDHDLLAQLAGNDGLADLHFGEVVLGRFEVAVRVDLASASAAERVHAVAIDRLAAAEAHADVALEANVVAGRELERVERGHHHLGLWVLYPLAKDGGIRCASVLVRHQVSYVVVGHCVTVAGESAVDSDRLNFDFEHEGVTDDGAAHFVTIGQADLHCADRRRASVGDGAGRGEHGHVEADGDRLFGNVVHAAHLVRLSFERHQFGMFLDHQDEIGLSVFEYQAASIKANLEINAASVSFCIENATTSLVLGVALHVENAVESSVTNVNIRLYSIGQTVDHDVRSREVGAERWRFRHAGTRFRFVRVTRDACANWHVIRRLTLGVRVANDVGARIAAHRVVAVLVGRAVVVGDALRRDGRADTDAIGSFDEAFSSIANAGAVRAHDQLACGIANASSVGQFDLALDGHAAFVDDRNGDFDALSGGVSYCSRRTETDHGASGNGGLHFANGRFGARLQSAARIFTVSVDARLEFWAFAIRSASDGDVGASASRVGRSLESRRAFAHSGMVERLAFLVLGANVGQRARVGAQAVDASLVGRAVVQVGTSDSFAAELRVSFSAGRAFANGTMLDADADRSTLADKRIADRFALTVDAGVRSRALLVRLAAGFVASDERIAGESFLTGAHRFALDHAADGVGAAVAGALADSVAAGLIRGTLGIGLAANDRL